MENEKKSDETIVSTAESICGSKAISEPKVHNNSAERFIFALIRPTWDASVPMGLITKPMVFSNILLRILDDYSVSNVKSFKFREWIGDSR